MPLHRLCCILIGSLLLGFALNRSHPNLAQSDEPPCSIEQLDTDSINNTSPQIDGQHVVWTGNYLGESTIYLYDSATETTTRLSDQNGRVDESPDIAGRYVVWSGNDGNDLEIYLYDLQTQTTINISNTDRQHDRLPKIVGLHVLWTNYNGYYTETYLYDIATQQKVSLHATASEVTLGSDHAVYASTFGESEIYLYNFRTGSQTNISQNPDYRDYSPVIDEHYVAWVGYDGHDEDIILYDLNTGQKTNLSNTDNADELGPIMDGARLMWMAWEGSQRKVSLYEARTGNLQILPLGIDNYVIDGPRVAWNNDGGPGAGEDIFLYDGVTRHQLQQDPNIDDEYPKLSGNLVIWESYSYTDDSQHIYLATCEPLAPIFVDQSLQVTITTGTSATLFAKAKGDGSILYQWYQGVAGNTSQPVAATTSETYITPPLVQVTQYWVRATTDYGTVDSLTITVSPGSATATPVPPTSTPAPPNDQMTPTSSVLATPTQIPTPNPVVNGAFTLDTDGDKLPDEWRGKATNGHKADKLKCDKADKGKHISYSTPCAFAFYGNPDGSSSKVTQFITDLSFLDDEITLIFSAWVNPGSAPAGTKFAQVRLIYRDGSSRKLKLVIPSGSGYIKQEVRKDILLMGNIDFIKLDLMYNHPSGKFYVDDVLLKARPMEQLLSLP